MNKKKEENPRFLVVTTSTFPRWKHDTDPPFVYELCRRAVNTFPVQVICPHTAGSQTDEVMSKIDIHRFKYCFTWFEKLAYEGGILTRLQRNPLRFLLVPLFLCAETYAVFRVLRKNRVGCINAHWMIPQGVTAVLAAGITGSRCPVICTLHGGDIFSLRGKLFTVIKRSVLDRSSAVVVVSNAMKKAVVELGIEPEKINVIPMGVDLKKTFVPGSEPKKKKSLLFVGRFVEKKGVRYLLEAMPSVAKKHPEAELILIGNGPLEQNMKKIAQQYGIRENVTFKGAVPNSQLPRYYQEAEIVVFPSIVEKSGDTEGFGLVMVEAMGCGCAVIASDLPVVSDICVDNRTGLLAEQKNAEMIAQRIIELLDDPGKRRSLAEAGRRHVLERYDWDIVGKRYCALVEKEMFKNRSGTVLQS